MKLPTMFRPNKDLEEHIKKLMGKKNRDLTRVVQKDPRIYSATYCDLKPEQMSLCIYTEESRITWLEIDYQDKEQRKFDINYFDFNDSYSPTYPYYTIRYNKEGLFYSLTAKGVLKKFTKKALTYAGNKNAEATPVKVLAALSKEKHKEPIIISWSSLGYDARIKADNEFIRPLNINDLKEFLNNLEQGGNKLLIEKVTIEGLTLEEIKRSNMPEPIKIIKNASCF
ncbi:MAG: hypothetical protein KKA79_04705 [Nanoarchaeota archaeon]|nr:hypothetical protein [Nanoarchaeota archaeon]